MHDMECWTVAGDSFKGYMLKIADPSRVYLGTIPEFGEIEGVKVSALIAADNAVAGINGGASYWEDTVYYTGLPMGAGDLPWKNPV